MGRRAVFVINPVSDHGKTGREWPRIAAEAKMRGLEVSERLTMEPGHATALAREAVLAGEELVVAVGGDGTVNEVVNGFCTDAGEPLGASTRLGIVERGTGCDFIRTFGIPKKARDAVAILAGDATRRIDLGRARFRAADGSEAVRMFANVASCGMTGDVAVRANRTTKRFGGTPSFLWATATAFFAWENVEFSVRIDDTERRVLANNVVCANCRYFGGGIKIAPDAQPDDGLLDVVIIGDVGKLDLALNLHRMYGGTLGKHPKVEILRARTVTCQPERTVPVEIDGEQPGATPITFDVAAGAIELVIPG